jgi:TPR repeat protein
MRARLALGLSLLLLSVVSPAAQTRSVFDDNPKASRDFASRLQKAKRGDSDAQFRIGLAYEVGAGVQQDYSQAVRWYRQAADHGNSSAQNNLGAMYGRGLGVSQSDSEAMRWYLRAASDGHPAAENNVGTMFATGQGVKTSDEDALFWYRKAAKQHYAPAEANLGGMYLTGSGVAADSALVRGGRPTQLCPSRGETRLSVYTRQWGREE